MSPWSLARLEDRCRDLIAQRKQKPPLPDECVVPRAALRALCRLVRAAAVDTGLHGGLEMWAALEAFEVEAQT